MRSKVLMAVALSVTATVFLSPAAGAGGGPNPGVLQGGGGLLEGPVRYVTVPAGSSTVLQVIRRRDGRVLNFMSLLGRWGIPAVAADGSADGLMADGRTLVLGQWETGPSLRKRSKFAFIDVQRMRLKRVMEVRGHLIFDALSRNDRYLYLTEYVSEQDYSRYRVRAYDLRAERLLPGAIIDKREWESTMQGWAVSRAKAQDGWVYTLYGSNNKSFIHALDTQNVTAICIDLPWRQQPKRLYTFRLRLAAEGQLVVRGPHGRALVTVDRGSHRILRSVSNP
jgi:hypothetical protein